MRQTNPVTMTISAPAKALICLTDTLQATGLKEILRRFHDISAEVVATVADIPAEALIFVDPLTYAAATDTLAGRRHAVVMVARSAVASLTTLDPSLPFDRLVEAVGAIVSRRDDAPASRQQSALSAREIEVLRLAARGFINKEIADTLGISFNTVLTHRRNISAKLGIRSVSGLGVYAVINGLISPSDI